MSNIAILFDNKTVDGDSAEFTNNRPKTMGFADTEFSSYIEIYGDNGGGTIELHKATALDPTDFKKDKVGSAAINDQLPLSGIEMIIVSVNYKSKERFKLVLTGATSPALFANGINMSLAT